MKRLLFVLGAFSLSNVTHAQEWSFTPHIYARGGLTINPNFEYRGSNNPDDIQDKWNLGPWQSESNMFAPALTEVTLEAAYGDSFKFFYGFDVENNQRFIGDNPPFDKPRSALNERVAYLQYFKGDMSLWFGNRPYRSEAEYLTRAYTFDEKNLYGGGFRFERVGPTNIELAYGVTELSYINLEPVAEHGNILINKVELPLSNGMIQSHIEYQQYKKRSLNEEQVGSTHGYILGASYKRWGDEVLGGNLYNQLLVQYGTGLVRRHFMGSVFTGQNAYSDDFDANKVLVQWNGDWKAERLAVYWASFYQMHTGKDVNKILEDNEMQWTTLDTFIRPQYGVLDNVTVGGEFARRVVLTEGQGVPTWAQNQGARRVALMINYHLENRFFDNPVISLFAGRMYKDRDTEFYVGRHSSKEANFIRLNYEINIH